MVKLVSMEAQRTIFTVYWMKFFSFNIQWYRVWLFKCRWFDKEKNKNHNTHVELGYKSINTSCFLFHEESVILAIQAHQDFYIDNPKNGFNWKIVQVIQNKRIWDVSKVEDVEDQQLNVLEVVVGQCG